MKAKILVTGVLHENAVALLEGSQNFELLYHPDCPREKIFEIFASTEDIQVLLTRSETKIDKKIIDAATEMKVIARAAVGVGNIDVGYATERGILVINTPGKNTNSAAEITLGLMLGMVRNLPQGHNHMKSGGWDRHKFTGSELRGKKIGIVGLGNVGHRVAKFCHGFDMKVFAYDPYISPRIFERHHVTGVSSLKELARQVDFLSVHVPKNEETTGMVDQSIIDAMQDGSYLINAARGGIIDEVACLESLNSEKISGAAIDTWLNEPSPLESLVRHERCWVSPHIGASTEEAQRAIGETVVAQVEKALEGAVVDYPVNLPEIGIIDNPLQKPYAVLSAKLGSLAAQLKGFNPMRIEVFYRGDLAGLDQSLIRLGLVKGYISHVVNGFVSFVNAQTHFEKVGIEIVEKQDPSFSGYRSGLKIRVMGSNGEELTLSGVVFDEEIIRISSINEYSFEVEPNGAFVVTENDDRPGVIGNIGLCLAKEGINIDSFDLSRNKAGGKAMALIKVDQQPSSGQMSAVGAIENLLSARTVNL